MISDAQLTLKRKTPTWVLQAKNDPVLPFAVNGQHMATVIGNALLTAYEDVTWDSVTYNGHWSWIYVARNGPSTAGSAHLAVDGQAVAQAGPRRSPQLGRARSGRADSPVSPPIHVAVGQCGMLASVQPGAEAVIAMSRPEARQSVARVRRHPHRGGT